MRSAFDGCVQLTPRVRFCNRLCSSNTDADQSRSCSIRTLFVVLHQTVRFILLTVCSHHARCTLYILVVMIASEAPQFSQAGLVGSGCCRTWEVA